MNGSSVDTGIDLFGAALQAARTAHAQVLAARVELECTLKSGISPASASESDARLTPRINMVAKDMAPGDTADSHGRAPTPAPKDAAGEQVRRQSFGVTLGEMSGFMGQSVSCLLEELKSSAKEAQRVKVQRSLHLAPLLDGFDEGALTAQQRRTVSGLRHRVKEVNANAKNIEIQAVEAISNADGPHEILAAVKEASVLLCADYENSSSQGSLRQAYYFLLRLKLAYMFLACLTLLLSVSSGTIMMIFFSIYVTPQSGASVASTAIVKAVAHDTVTAVSFWFLPFTIILFGLLGDEMVDIIFDALDSPALARFQATCLAALHQRPDRPPSSNRCFFVDCLMIALLEVVPLCSAVAAWILGVGIWMAYVQGMLLAAAMMSMLFAFSDVFVSMGAYSAKAGEEGDRSETQSRIHSALDSHKVFPGQLHKKRVVLKVYLNKEAGDITMADKAAATAKRHGILEASALVMVAAWSVIAVFALINRISNLVTSIALLLTVAVLSVCLHLRLPGILGPAYAFIVTVFILIAAFLVASSTDSVNPSHIKPLMLRSVEEAWPNQDSLPLPTNWKGGPAGRTYAACSIPWGDPQAPLSVVDLASLSWIVYEPDCERMARLLSEGFPHREVRIENCTVYDGLPRWASFYFPPSGSEPGTRVISVKGTSSVTDVLTDIDLYATVKVMTLFSRVQPLLSIIPLSVVQWFISSMYLSAYAHTREQEIWGELETSSASIMRRHPEDFMVVTGHSLGGGIARIVAANLQLPALVFSPPGVIYSAKRFGINLESAQHGTVAVVPDYDEVPMVDLQAGLVQPIQCRSKDGQAGTATLCHSLVKTTCELWRVCGDIHARNFSATCRDYVTADSVGQLYNQKP